MFTAAIENLDVNNQITERIISTYFVMLTFSIDSLSIFVLPGDRPFLLLLHLTIFETVF